MWGVVGYVEGRNQYVEVNDALTVWMKYLIGQAITRSMFQFHFLLSEYFVNVSSRSCARSGRCCDAGAVGRSIEHCPALWGTFERHSTKLQSLNTQVLQRVSHSKLYGRDISILHYCSEHFVERSRPLLLLSSESRCAAKRAGKRSSGLRSA